MNFKRYEKKYLITHTKQMPILETLSGATREAYTVSNIYYDTDDYELIRKSIEKPHYKEKLRVRSYGNTEDPYIEIKKKYDGIVYKRRNRLPIKEGSQFARELDFFLNRYDVKPKMFIAYERLALELDDLRVTFDSNVRYRLTELDFKHGSWGEFRLPTNEVLMEIKTPTAIPTWLCEKLSELEIYPSSFSKYGTCYKQLLKGGQLSA